MVFKTCPPTPQPPLLQKAVTVCVFVCGRASISRLEPPSVHNLDRLVFYQLVILAFFRRPKVCVWMNLQHCMLTNFDSYTSLCDIGIDQSATLLLVLDITYY